MRQRVLAVLAALGGAWLWQPRAAACSCSGQGPSSALTRPDQTWGVRASERLVLGQGAFNAHGKYAAFGSSEQDRTLEYTLLAAYRIGHVELATTWSYGRREAMISSESGRTTGLGDAIVRARLEAFDEPEPWQHGIAPKLAMIGSLRLPTGRATGLTPLGTGATELALGVTLERSFARWFRFGLLAEVAGRLPDTTLGYTRRLGPRALSELSLSYFATRDLALSVLAGTRWEGDVSVGQRREYGTAQRTSEVGALLAWRPWSSPFRSGLSARYAPAIDALGANTVQNLTSELWLGYVR
jgi:hypothetical protein